MHSCLTNFWRWRATLRTIHKEPDPKGSACRTPKSIQASSSLCALLLCRLSFQPGHMLSPTNACGKSSPNPKYPEHNKPCIQASSHRGYRNIRKLSLLSVNLRDAQRCKALTVTKAPELHLASSFFCITASKMNHSAWAPVWLLREASPSSAPTCTSSLQTVLQALN